MIKGEQLHAEVFWIFPTLFFLPSTSNTDIAPFLYTSSPGGCFHTHLACRKIDKYMNKERNILGSRCINIV